MAGTWFFNHNLTPYHIYKAERLQEIWEIKFQIFWLSTQYVFLLKNAEINV